MRGNNNSLGTFYHCSEVSDRNWVIKVVDNLEVGSAARIVCKNPEQRLDTGVIPTAWWFTPEAEAQLNAVGEDGRMPSSSGSVGGSTATSSGLGADATSSSDGGDGGVNLAQLKARLKAQLEYYFSRENLNQDRYLRSQMDSDQYVSIATIGTFPKISQLSTDIELITMILKESPNVQVDESNLKVRAVNRRCTLLLREIPEFTDDREVKAMFTDCPPYTSLTYGLNNSWYVTFATEEATQSAYLHLQNLQKTFNGKPLCVRIKSGTAPVPEPDHGRYSPAKSDITSPFTTITTSKGIITGIPSGGTLMLNPTTKVTNAEGQELSLDQLLGSFGFTVRAIFQPSVALQPTAPAMDTTHSLPELEVADPPDGRPVLGPPSTEIVNSLLSAAAEANETKKREREHQRRHYQQIMDGMAPAQAVSSVPRITDQPHINRNPTYKRLVSQESTEIEVAMDLQRAARLTKEVPPPVAVSTHSVKAPIVERGTTSRQSGKTYAPASSNNHHYGSSSNYNNSYNNDNRYHGYSERGANRNDGTERRNYGNTRDRTDRRNYDNRSTRTDNDRSYGIRTVTNSSTSSGGRYYSNSTASNYRGTTDRRPQQSNDRSYGERRPAQQQQQQRNYNVSTGVSSVLGAPPPTQSYHATATPLLQFSDPVPVMSKPPPRVEISSHSHVNPIPTPVVVPMNVPSSITSPVATHQQTSMPIIAKTPPSSDTMSTASSSRRKGNSESSEYNFVDCDFPSLIDKEKAEKTPPKPKEKAKFSAVVAGRKNESPEELQRKKSYASTLKKHSLPTSVPETGPL